MRRTPVDRACAARKRPEDPIPAMDAQLLLAYLDARRSAVTPAAAQTHRQLCEADPAAYVALIADRAAVISHQREVLANLLTLPSAHRVAVAALRERVAELPAEDRLQVVGVVLARRINSSRARTLLRGVLIDDALLPQFAPTHRQRLIRLLTHLLGEQTWYAIERHLTSPTPEGEVLLTRALLRGAPDSVRMREALCFLAGVPIEAQDPLLQKRIAARSDIDAGQGLPRETLYGLRGVYHRDLPRARVRTLAAIATDNGRQDGPLTALYKAALLELSVQELEAQLPAHLQAAVGGLPKVDSHVAIVLDLSASAAASGERACHPAALGLALARMLSALVARVTLHVVGGGRDDGSDIVGQDIAPAPQGVTDLAQALLTVAREKPQVTLLITDGYENLRPGDAALVAEGLRQLGWASVIYEVVPLYVESERLEQRRLGAPIQTITVTHEGEARELLARILLHTHGPALSDGDATLAQDLAIVR
jgi:hypothetical protein